MVTGRYNGKNIDGTLKWFTNWNLSYYRDKVTNYYATTTSGNAYVAIAKNPVLQRPVYGTYSYKWAGLDDNGNPQGYLNGNISKDYPALTGSGTQLSDLIFNGPRFPVLYGSMGNTLSYKGISLTARLSYNFGNYFRKSSISYSILASAGVTNGADYARRWQKPGDENITNVPAFAYPLSSNRDNFYGGSQPNILRADAIRLQYITLSYNLNKKQYSWLPFTSAQFFVNANNLGILWRANKEGLDPDYAENYSVIPPAKTFAIGLRANL